MWHSIFYIIFFVLLFNGTALADIASTTYVSEIVDVLNTQSDWAQTDENAPNYIKNKPVVPSTDSVEYVSNKIQKISDTSTENQYPSAIAVREALKEKADLNDDKFNSIPTSQPSGLPPDGRVFIWFN